MKKINGLIFLILSSIVACNYNTSFDYSFLMNNSTSTNYKSAKYLEIDLNFDEENYKKAKDDVWNVINNDLSRDKLNETYSYVNQLATSLRTKYNVARINYYGDPSDDNNALFLKLFDLINDYSTFRSDIVVAVYNHGNPEHIKAFFGERNDEEIKEYINSLFYDEESSILNKEISNLQNSYDSIFNSLYSLDSEEAIDKALDNFYSSITLQKSLAKHNNYTDYLQFLYDNNGRDYKSDSLTKFVANVKELVVPFLNDNAKTFSSVYLDFDNYSFYKGLRTLNLFNKSINAMEVFDDFSSYMGEKYRAIYKHFWNNGFYYFSDNENCLSTASVTSVPSFSDYMAFFGKNYQKATDVIHEFGHYEAFRGNPAVGYASLDTLETHSQGNEFMYLSYYQNKEQNNRLRKDGIDAFVASKLLSSLDYIVQYSLITELENYAYSCEDLTRESLETTFYDYFEDYGGLADNIYWSYACVVQPGYYESYATSLVGALEIYAQSRKDFDKAKDNFITFLYYPDTKATTLDIFKNSNLSSPFEKETMESIINCISDELQKYSK